MSAYRQMTMPDERAAAVMRTREFLIRLAPSADGFVPDAVRMDAQTLLRHYPCVDDIALTCENYPRWWQMPLRGYK